MSKEKKLYVLDGFKISKERIYELVIIEDEKGARRKMEDSNIEITKLTKTDFKFKTKRWTTLEEVIFFLQIDIDQQSNSDEFCTTGDKEELESLLKLLVKEKWKKAYAKARSMDTACRGYIPEDIWTILHFMNQ